jgi:phosphate starvation-inducible PhoH-like protein
MTYHSNLKENILTKRKTSELRVQDSRASRRYDEKTYYTSENKTINFNKEKSFGKPKKSLELIPKTENQEKFILALTDDKTDIVVVSGPAGTGKTYLTMLSIIKAFKAGEYERIVLCRPSITIENESHGFLPGDLNSKLEPWMKPMIDVLREFYSMKEIEFMLEEQIIEFAPLGMMRGRTFKNTVIFADEMQNGTPTQFKMLLTRIGENSKIILGGDVEQTDRKSPDNGLMDLMKKLKSNPINGISLCSFNEKDIQRHRLISEILKIY